MPLTTTIERAISERQIRGDKDLIPWANKEVIPLIQEMRDAHNLESVFVFTLTTAHTGAFATIWTSDAVPTNTTWTIRAEVNARASSGAAQQSSYGRVGLFTNEAGVVSQVGATTSLWTIESAAGADVQFTLSGQTVLFQVKDDGVSTYAWKVKISILPSDEV